MSFFFLSIALLIGLACGKTSTKHDEMLAGMRAVEFAEAAFVRQDIESAYTQFSHAAKRYVSGESFRKTVVELHPKGYPTRIEAIEYELIPMEKRLIYIFLVGDASEAKFLYYYRLTMEGTSESDYEVLVIRREYRRYRNSPLRKPLRIK